ncbi:MAG: L-threonylcarbamoyladenylate synthase [Cytophagales bacterium]
MLVEIHPDNPQPRIIKQIVDCLKSGGIIIYPTDSLYGIGCDLHNPKAVEKLCKLKQIKPNKLDLSFICNDLSQVSEYTKPLNSTVFKLIKSHTPGPYTFILESNTKVPKIVGYPKKTVGVRIPNSKIIQSIVHEFGSPIVSMSVKDSSDEINPYITDPENILEKYEHLVDIIINGGVSGNIPTSVIDCTTNPPELIRQGLGEVEIF